MKPSQRGFILRRIFELVVRFDRTSELVDKFLVDRAASFRPLEHILGQAQSDRPLDVGVTATARLGQKIGNVLATRVHAGPVVPVDHVSQSSLHSSHLKA